MVGGDGVWVCNDNAVISGKTVDVGTEPSSCTNSPACSDPLFIGRLLAGMFAGAEAVAFTPVIAPVLTQAAQQLARWCAAHCQNPSRWKEVTHPNSNVWSLRPFERGVEIENFLGRNLVQNFPTIDRFVRGTATSIKTLDLNAKTYQNANRLQSTVQGYIDGLANWTGQLTPHGGVTISPSQITGRVVELGIPVGAKPDQVQVLQNLQQYAQNVGVRLDIIVVK